MILAKRKALFLLLVRPEKIHRFCSYLGTLHFTSQSQPGSTEACKNADYFSKVHWTCPITEQSPLGLLSSLQFLLWTISTAHVTFLLQTMKDHEIRISFLSAMSLLLMGKTFCTCCDGAVRYMTNSREISDMSEQVIEFHDYWLHPWAKPGKIRSP